MSLKIEHTADTPLVSFNPGENTITISGNCYPENAFTFFKPLLDWIEEHHSEFTGSVIIEIKLNYFNSSSGRFLLKFINRCHQLIGKSRGLSVAWIYEKGDELIKERGEEISSVLEVDFRLIEL